MKVAGSGLGHIHAPQVFFFKSPQYYATPGAILLDTETLEDTTPPPDPTRKFEECRVIPLRERGDKFLSEYEKFLVQRGIDIDASPQE
jgi:hypothetical protein